MSCQRVQLSKWPLALVGTRATPHNAGKRHAKEQAPAVASNAPLVRVRSTNTSRSLRCSLAIIYHTPYALNYLLMAGRGQGIIEADEISLKERFFRYFQHEITGT